MSSDDETFEALVDNSKSDSANLDSVVELLVQSGKSPTEALMVMVPEAYRSQPALNSRPEVRITAAHQLISCPDVYGVKDLYHE